VSIESRRRRGDAVEDGVDSKEERVMAGFVLGRKSHGGGRGRDMSDLRVFASGESDGTFSIGLRVSESVMKRMRWLHGDSVVASFDDEGMVWTIRRVADSKKGNRLSNCGRTTSHGTVRFTAVEEWLAQAGLSAGDGYDCKLKSSDGESASFVML
jgi:hypothetical protein